MYKYVYLYINLYIKECMQLPGCGKTNFNIYELYMWELHIREAV